MLTSLYKNSIYEKKADNQSIDYLLSQAVEKVSAAFFSAHGMGIISRLKLLNWGWRSYLRRSDKISKKNL
ncbi:hypothetical protein H70357_08265 [Paenibacillus sp. FSL H7-0357]|nr:hypothetical protein H70357_08265 [Paenibacillus sp. FSL H7-0357]